MAAFRGRFKRRFSHLKGEETMPLCCGMGRWKFVSAVSCLAFLAACSEDSDSRATLPPAVSMCGPDGMPTSPGSGNCAFSAAKTCLDDQVVECVRRTPGDCYEARARCAPGTCVAGSPSPHCANCEELRKEYENLLAVEYRALAVPGSTGIAPGAHNYANQCQPDDCSTTTPAHCELGLGPCWYLGKPIPRLDQLANAYQLLGCNAPVTCNCPAQLVNASCEAKPEGYRVWGGPFSHACVVE